MADLHIHNVKNIKVENIQIPGKSIPDFTIRQFEITTEDGESFTIKAFLSPLFNENKPESENEK